MSLLLPHTPKTQPPSPDTPVPSLTPEVTSDLRQASGSSRPSLCSGYSFWEGKGEMAPPEIPAPFAEALVSPREDARALNLGPGRNMDTRSGLEGHSQGAHQSSLPTSVSSWKCFSYEAFNPPSPPLPFTLQPELQSQSADPLQLQTGRV